MTSFISATFSTDYYGWITAEAPKDDSWTTSVKFHILELVGSNGVDKEHWIQCLYFGRWK